MQKVSVMWFSRHEMSTEQDDALVKSIRTRFGENSHIVIKQVNGTAPNVHVAFMATNAPENTEGILPTAHSSLKELVKEFDVVAVVLSTNLLEQLLPFMGDAPLLTAMSERVMGDNGKPHFVFQKWVQVIAVKIETQDY